MLHVRRDARRRVDRRRRRLPDPTTIGRGVDAGRDRPLDGDRLRSARGRPAGPRSSSSTGWWPTSPRCATGCSPSPTFDPLLRWLAEGQFVFLGAATYDTCRGRGATGVRTLGQLDESSARSIRRCALDGRAGVDRPLGRARLDPSLGPHDRGLGACTTDADGKPVVDRFVGLLASTAYRQSVLSIPSVGDRARAVLGLADGRRRDAHRAIDAQRARDTPARPRVRARRRTRWPSS